MSIHVTDPIDVLQAACDHVFTFDAPAIIGCELTPTGLAFPVGPPIAAPNDLIGLAVPESWTALAVVSTGVRAHADGSSERARLTFGLHRDDVTFGTVTTISGSHRLDQQAAPQGPLVDICRRVLGLAVARERSRPIHALDVAWLADLVDLTHEFGPQPLEDNWESLTALHPFPHFPAARTWADVLDATVDAGRGWGELNPEQLRWLGPDAWGRMVLSQLPPLAELLCHLESTLCAPTMQKVRSHLHDRAGSVRGDGQGVS